MRPGRLFRRAAQTSESMSPESLSVEEYTEMKEDTMEQLEDLGRTLDRMQCGDVSLTDQLTATRMAIRAAISEAFKTPEVVAIFAKKQPAQLRQKLVQVESDFRMHKITEEVYRARKVEILYALLKLGAELSEEEEAYLRSSSAMSSVNFELAPSHTSCDESRIAVDL